MNHSHHPQLPLQQKMLKRSHSSSLCPPQRVNRENRTTRDKGDLRAAYNERTSIIKGKHMPFLKNHYGDVQVKLAFQVYKLPTEVHQNQIN